MPRRPALDRSRPLRIFFLLLAVGALPGCGSGLATVGTRALVEEPAVQATPWRGVGGLRAWWTLQSPGGPVRVAAHDPSGAPTPLVTLSTATAPERRDKPRPAEATAM